MQFPQNIQSLPHETPGASLHSLLRGDDALTNDIKLVFSDKAQTKLIICEASTLYF
jgi:hypothetical protein